MEILIIFYPFFGAVISLLFGNFLGTFYITRLTTGLVFSSLLFSFFIFFKILKNNLTIFLSGFLWFNIDFFPIEWNFFFDSLTIIMLLVILFISFFVHLYSINYMEKDPHIIRFFGYLSLFTFFMLVLVTAGNFLQLFVGWEGVGVCSYLLINFWFTRKQANKSALKAMVVNRIGDFGLLFGMILIFYVFKTLNFPSIFALSILQSSCFINFFGYSFNSFDLISLFLFFGAVGKSAQVGLHVWLPDAMEGPTPVSALIHAATMVTAGVFLLVRCSPLLEFSPSVLSIICFFGAVTAFFGATTGLLQHDIKRVVAYSTCSQLGYMVFACGTSSYSAAMFHLYNHAFFKALLFLGAGSVIHAFYDEQDMRKFGGLAKLLPFTYISILIGSMSLMGFPFLTGFYSKDQILELSFVSFDIFAIFSYWLGVISAFFTAFYSVRLLYLTFLSEARGGKKDYIFVGNHEASVFICVSLFVLSVFSIFVGFFSKEFFVGIGTDFWGNSLCVLPQNVCIVQAEFSSFAVKILPVFFSILGAVVSFFSHFYLYSFLVRFSFVPIFNYIYNFLNKKWYFDVIYNKGIVSFFLYFGYSVSFKFFDRGLIEIFGPTGISKLIFSVSKNYSYIHSGYIYHYIFLMVSGFIIFLIFIFGLISFQFLKFLLLDCLLFLLIIGYDNFKLKVDDDVF